jgi:hypothetical protein
MEIIIVLGGVELNEWCGDGRSGSSHDKSELPANLQSALATAAATTTTSLRTTL